MRLFLSIAFLSTVAVQYASAARAPQKNVAIRSDAPKVLENLEAEQRAWSLKCVKVMNVSAKDELPTGTVTEMCEHARPNSHMSDAQCFNFADSLVVAFDKHSLLQWCDEAFAWFVQHLDNQCTTENCHKRLLCHSRCAESARRKIAPEVQEANDKVAALARQGLAQTAARMTDIAKVRRTMRAENTSMRGLRLRSKELVKQLKETQEWSSKMQMEFDKQGETLKTQSDFKALVKSGHALGLELQKVQRDNTQSHLEVESWQSKVKAFQRRDAKEQQEEQKLFKKSAQMMSMKKSKVGTTRKQYEMRTENLQATEGRLARQRSKLEAAERMLEKREIRVHAEEHGLAILAARVKAVVERMRSQKEHAQNLKKEVADLEQHLKTEENGIDAAKAWLGSAKDLLEQRTEKAAQTALELNVPYSLKPHEDVVGTLREAISLAMKAWGSNATSAAKIATASSSEKAELGAVTEELRNKINETRSTMTKLDAGINSLHLQRGNLTHQLAEMEEKDAKLELQVKRLKHELMIEGSLSAKQIEADIAMTREALQRLFNKVSTKSVRKRNVVGELGQSLDRLHGLRNFLLREEKVHAELENRLNSTTKELERDEAQYQKLSNDADAEEQALSDEEAQFERVSKAQGDAEAHVKFYRKLEKDSIAAFTRAADKLAKALADSTAADARKEQKLRNITLQHNKSLTPSANITNDIAQREKRVADLKAKIDDEERRIKAEKHDVELRRGELVRAVVSEVPEKQSAAERASAAYYAAEAEAEKARKVESHTRVVEEKKLNTLKATQQMLMEHLHRAQMIEKQGDMRFNALQKKRKDLVLKARMMLEQEKAAQVSRASITIQRQKVHKRAEMLLKEITAVQQQLKTVQEKFAEAKAQLHTASRKAALEIRSLSERKKKAEEVAAKLNESVRGLQALISE